MSSADTPPSPQFFADFTDPRIGFHMVPVVEGMAIVPISSFTLAQHQRLYAWHDVGRYTAQQAACHRILTGGTWRQ